MHTAPGHGQEDYEVGLQYGLDIYNPVRGDGRYDETVGAGLTGLRVFEANPLDRRAAGRAGRAAQREDGHGGAQLSALLALPQPGHLPRDVTSGSSRWTSRSTDGQDAPRSRRWSEVDRVELGARVGPQPHPRHAGGPAGLVHQPPADVGRAHPDRATARAAASRWSRPELMERVAAGGGEGGRGRVVPHAGGGVPGRRAASAPRAAGPSSGARRTSWMCGSTRRASFAAVLEQAAGQRIPADLFLEGSDQHRGWFHSSLLVAVGTRDESPYRACSRTASWWTAKGEKMSKSEGNVVAPEKIIQQYGAEVLRLWVAASDYRDDVRLSDQILQGLSRGLPEDPQHAALRAGQPLRLRSGEGRGAGGGAAAAGPLGARRGWRRWWRGCARPTRATSSTSCTTRWWTSARADLSAVYFDILKDRLYTCEGGGAARGAARRR